MSAAPAEPTTADLPDLSGYRRVVVLTGAGISAPSGIPTYRDHGSGWRDGQMEKLSHASRYGNHLPLLWGFWGALRALTAAAVPNAAHNALGELQKVCDADGGFLRVATQNIDGLHQRGGVRDVVELHGSIHRSRCMKRGCGPAYDDGQVPTAGQVPPCPTCGRNARPDVVLFGEQLRASDVKATLRDFGRSDLCLYIGTSGNVWPAAEMVATARLAGARCVLVNAEPWDHPSPDFHDTVLGDASVLLPQLLGQR